MRTPDVRICGIISLQFSSAISLERKKEREREGDEETDWSTFPSECLDQVCRYVPPSNSHQARLREQETLLNFPKAGLDWYRRSKTLDTLTLRVTSKRGQRANWAESRQDTNSNLALHGTLNKHMHRIGLSNTKSSRFCGLEDVTARNEFCCCDALERKWFPQFRVNYIPSKEMPMRGLGET